MRYRSLIGGAIGDIGFDAGDLIDVPDDRVDVWLAAGLIEPVLVRRPRRVVDMFASDGVAAADSTEE